MPISTSTTTLAEAASVSILSTPCAKKLLPTTMEEDLWLTLPFLDIPCSDAVNVNKLRVLHDSFSFLFGIYFP